MKLIPRDDYQELQMKGGIWTKEYRSFKMLAAVFRIPGHGCVQPMARTEHREGFWRWDGENLTVLDIHLDDYGWRGRIVNGEVMTESGPAPLAGGLDDEAASAPPALTQGLLFD